MKLQMIPRKLEACEEFSDSVMFSSKWVTQEQSQGLSHRARPAQHLCPLSFTGVPLEIPFGLVP